MHAAREKTTPGPTSGADPAPLVVGPVHDAASLAAACRRRLETPAPDVFEIRLDRLVPPPAAWDLLLRRQIILTARHPLEGGPKGLDAAQRRRLLLEHLEVADAIDLELRSLPGFRDVAAAAAQAGAARIVSFHDFRGTPSVERLREIAERAAEAGADIVKIATTTNTPAELARLFAFAAEPAAVPLACMGMGALGRLSRLLLASTGSALVYCALGEANAVGQWPVAEFRAALGQLAGGSKKPRR
ncbi:MAG: type I 3-dehydroquinate dehydratase [Verrucomicrobia bacterium]|nr:type I 3-dehydroquinate dehydratase [Verrucomicrobiota bacterium]